MFPLNFLKRCQSFPFYSFPAFLCTDHWGRLSYHPCYSLTLCIQMGISFLFSVSFYFSCFHSYLQGLLRQPFCFFAFLFLGHGLFSVSCTMSQTSIHSLSGTLAYQISSLQSISYFYCIIVRDWFRSYLNGLVVFPTFFNLSLNLAINSSWSEP